MSLQRNRTLVRDLMQVGVTTCSPDALIWDVARMMLEKELDAVIVLDQDEGHALGVVSQRELAQAYLQEGKDGLRAQDIMHEGEPQIPPDIPITAAVQMMLDQDVRTFFLVHHAGGVTYPAAYISYHHILRYLAARGEGDLQGLGIEAARKNPIESFMERRDAARRRNIALREE